jgi:hypothetical protein
VSTSDQPDEILTDFEDLSGMALDAQGQRDLVGDTGMCVLTWTTEAGHPMGVAVQYVYQNGTFWTTAVEGRKRVPALRARPKSSIIVSKGGSSATYKGISVIHQPGDVGWEALRDWFFSALSGTDKAPDDPVARLIHDYLDSPSRVIIETSAKLVVGFDWEKFEAAIGRAVGQLDRS